MAFSDRDYARAEPAKRGGLFAARGRRLAGLTLTTWLIVINVAVFVFDALAEQKWGVEVTMGEAYPAQLWTGSTPPTGSQRRAFITDNNRVLTRPEIGLAGYELHPIFLADSAGRIATRPDGSEVLVGFQRFMRMPPLRAAGHFSTGKGFSELQVWRLVLFQFLHADVNHLLFNMMGLFFFGPLIERFLGGGRRYLAFYLMCGICGALLYLLLNLLGGGFGLQLPALLVNDMYTPLIGASAGCFGVLIAAAYVAGQETMYVFGVIPMRVRTGAYLMVGLALLNLFWGGKNAGGDAAHVGGAIAGFFFIRRPHLLREFFDFFGPGRSKLGKVAPRRVNPARTAANPRPTTGDQRKLDEILDKVQRQGLHSLTEAERRFLDSMREP